VGFPQSYKNIIYKSYRRKRNRSIIKGGKHWIDFADRDLEAAKSLLENEYLANVVLFHCQQCIEKCLKAILEENNVEVPKIQLIKSNFKITILYKRIIGGKNEHSTEYALSKSY